MSNLLSGAWWKAAVIRALRTALVIAVPYAPTVLYDGTYLLVLSAAGFGAVASLLTSLFGIAESDGTKVVWYYAIFERVVKTAAQALLTAFGTATVFADVDWTMVPALVGSSVLGSLLLGVLGSLPEAEAPTALNRVTNVVITNPTTPLSAQGEFYPEASMQAGTAPSSYTDHQNEGS